MLQLSKPRTQFWLLVVILLVTLFVGYLFNFDETQWIDYFSRIPFPVAGILFIAAYVGITFCFWFVVKDLLRIVGAVVFGPFWSTFFVWIGELVNAAIFFHMSRRMGRTYVEEKFHIRKGRLDNAGRATGVWHILILRALPVIPFRIVDLAYGLTSVSFRKYLIISAIILPARIFWTQFIAAALGSSVLDIAKVMVYVEANKAYLGFSFLYLICSAIAVIVLRKRLR